MVDKCWANVPAGLSLDFQRESNHISRRIEARGMSFQEGLVLFGLNKIKTGADVDNRISK